MAQTTQPVKPAGTSGGAKNTPVAKAVAPTTPSDAAKPAFGQRLLGSLRGPRTNAPTASTSAKAGAPAGAASLRGSGKFVMGLIIFMLGAELLLYGLTLADAKFKLGLQNTVFPSKSVPQMAWLSWFQLLYFGAILIFWVLLLRFNIIPRDPFGTKAQAQARANAGRGGANRATGAKTTPAQQIPGIGERKPRAARRYATTRASAVTTAAPAKAESRPASAWRSLLPSALQPAKARSAGSQPAPSEVATSTRATPAKVVVSSGHDAAYERVKAAQRQQRRRSSKR